MTNMDEGTSKSMIARCIGGFLHAGPACQLQCIKLADLLPFFRFVATAFQAKANAKRAFDSKFIRTNL